MAIEVEVVEAVPMDGRPLEVVERKGVGHPDTICDSAAEAASLALSHAYLEAAGRVLHYNLDKALLVAGSSEPAFGGGRVTAPMRFLLGDRATAELDGRAIPVDEIVEDAVRGWVGEHLRFVDPAEHLVFESVLRPGSASLAGLFRERALPAANDTSAGVGFAPLSETERLVIAAERTLNSAGFQERFPAGGEDVKVMGVRRGRRLELTIAMAVVDRFVEDERAYFERVAEIEAGLRAELEARLVGIDALELVINALDARGRGAEGLYLTVLGTSAEGGDGGEVGRGNRVSGVIPFGRQVTLEAAAGKNAVRHVGKVYNLFAHELAARVHAEVEGVVEARVLLLSRIGRPLDDPWVASVEVVPGPELGGVRRAALVPAVRELVARELTGMGAFVERLTREGGPVC